MTALAVQAPNAGQMASPLKGTGPFTSFAPHLRGVRQTAKVAAADVMKLDGKTATTLNGGNLKVSAKGGVKLNGEVNVTKTDVAACNGLIHVIDAVLMPK